MAHTQKPDLVFQRNGRVHLNRRGCQFSRLLAVKECWSADSNCTDRAPSSSSRLLATHSIRIFPLHFPSRASPCAIRLRTRYKKPSGEWERAEYQPCRRRAHKSRLQCILTNILLFMICLKAHLIGYIIQRWTKLCAIWCEHCTVL